MSGAGQQRGIRILAHHLIGIDHVIVGVRDLEAARARYARLGFNSTPRGRHVGWGTANHCIMLERDYLELLGIVDASQFSNGLDRFLERAEGLLGVVLGTGDAQATHAAWQRAGLRPEKPRALGRLLARDRGEVELRFRNVLLPRDATGGINLFACEHLTPKPMRQPAWLRHPNGARAIRSCTFVVSDVAPVAEALGRIFGSATITATDNVVAAHTGHGVILLAPPEDAMLLHPLAQLPERAAEPVPVALTLEVADPERAASFLQLQGETFTRSPTGDVFVPPAEAHGVALELVRA